MIQMISVADFCRISNLGRTKAYELINDSSLESRKVGRRRLISLRSVEVFLGLDGESAAGADGSSSDENPKVGM